MNEILQAIYPIAKKHTDKIPNATIWPPQTIYEEFVHDKSLTTPLLDTINIQWTTAKTHHDEKNTPKTLTCHFNIIIKPEIIYITIQDFVAETIPLIDPQAIQFLEKFLKTYHQ